MSLLLAVCENKIHLQPDALLDLAKANDIPADAPAFQVFVVSCATECKTLDQYQDYQTLKRYCFRYCARRKEFFRYTGNDVNLIILLCVIRDPKQYRELDCAKNITDYLERHGLKNTTLIGGSIVDKFSDIHFSYERAYHTLGYMGTKGPDHIYFSHDYEHLFDLPVLQSTVDPHPILNIFRTGTLDDLREAVTNEVNRIRSVSGYVQGAYRPTSIRRSFIEWTVLILHLTADMGVDVDTLLGDVDPYRHLMSITGGTPAILEWFMALCEKLRAAIDDRKESKEDLMIARACGYIDEHLASYNLSLLTVSRAVNVSSSYFSRLFHEKKQIGFAQYIVQRRIERVKTMLRNTDLSIEEIALMAGFSSASYLGRQFKKAVGVTPKAYRLRA